MMEWNELYEALSEKLSSEELEDLIDRKARLDQINYHGIYDDAGFQRVSGLGKDLYLPKLNKTVDYVSLKPCETIIDVESPIAKAFYELQNTLQVLQSDKKELQIGAISNGVHSIDLLMRYFNKEEICKIYNKEQSHKRVMIIYEAPASNLYATAAYRSRSKAKNPEEPNDREPSVKDYLQKGKFNGEILDCLTGVWWRLDSLDSDVEKAINTNEAFSGAKKYTEFLVGFIRAFGILDLYTTNLFRYEIFKSDDEKSLGWDEVSKLTAEDGSMFEIIDIAFEKIVRKEIEAYKPNIILATSKPYNYLWYKKPENAERNKQVMPVQELKNIPIYKIPHPACQLDKDYRECVNICRITKVLCEANVITSVTASEIIKEHYLNRIPTCISTKD